MHLSTTLLPEGTATSHSCTVKPMIVSVRSEMQWNQ
jgi:hypothetical protein